MKMVLNKVIMQTYDKNKEDIIIEVTSLSSNIAHETIVAIRELLKKENIITGGSSTTVERKELVIKGERNENNK
jgi:hypothetical protein